MSMSLSVSHATSDTNCTYNGSSVGSIEPPLCDAVFSSTAQLAMQAVGELEGWSLPELNPSVSLCSPSIYKSVSPWVSKET